MASFLDNFVAELAFELVNRLFELMVLLGQFFMGSATFEERRGAIGAVAIFSIPSHKLN